MQVGYSEGAPFIVNSCNCRPQVVKVASCDTENKGGFAVPIIKRESGQISFSVTTAVQATMLMMASTIAYFGFVACSEGTFECTLEKFPDISHLMGGPPLNKLYAIMLTIYSCTKQAEARAYYHRFSGFLNPTINNFLLLAAATSFVFGPMIGFFDCYWDMDHHQMATDLFTYAEIAYGFTIYYVVSTNRNQFDASAGPAIDRCFYALCMATVVGICMNLGQEVIGPYAINQIGEWVAFYSDFFIHYQIATFIRYTSTVVPQN